MALPPTIPTSFVPHAPSAFAQRFRSDFTGAFGFFAYAILGIVLLFAVGVFLYGRLLMANQTSKDAALAQATAAIDRATVEDFVRLRNRLNAGDALLKKHVAFSNFFSLLGTLLPASVRFTSLHVALDSSGASKVEGSGIARNFNALAAVSTAFAADGNIKDAIFSNINVNRDNSVSFALSATLDAKLTAFSPDTVASSVAEPVQQSAPPAASTSPSL